MFEIFRESYEHRHDYAREWKAKHPNDKVIGFFCTYAPEELLYAADILPVRVLGSHEPQSVTEPYIFGMYCPFCRDCLAQGLQGRYKYLDGIIESQSCLHLRQTFTSWKMHVPSDFAYYLPMPHGLQSPRTYQYFAGELKTLKDALERWIGREITNEDLDRGIEIVNKNRRLMRQIYESRKAETPPLSGLEALYMVTSSQMMDKREHNMLLEEVLARLPGREVGGNDRYRLMTLGSENDDVEFVEMVEKLNATVVIDEHCTGTRYFWNEVEPQEDRLLAIASRYVDRPACPSKDWPIHTRMPHILRLARDWNVAGVLLMQQKFCDPHEFDIPVIAEEMKKAGIPTYFLELDATLAVGQFKVRVEAFLEMLGAEDLF